MKVAPPIDEIKKWLRAQNPLGIFSDDFSITDIDPKPWSGHFNYVLETNGRKIVLRFKGPEWGSAAGIVDEYNTLLLLNGKGFGPEALYSSMDFFGEPVVLEEYLVGRPLESLSETELKTLLPDVARFIARINGVSYTKHSFPFQKPMTSYGRNKDEFYERAAFVSRSAGGEKCGEMMVSLSRDIEKLLERFTPLLLRAVTTTNAFIFESSHIGHCLAVDDGFRFFNWEQVSYGDPSYTLAVFLTSIHTRSYFEDSKKQMIEAYLELGPIDGFRELVEQRITERHLSNIFWRIETSLRRDGVGVVPFNWNQELDRAKEIIASL